MFYKINCVSANYILHLYSYFLWYREQYETLSYATQSENKY